MTRIKICGITRPEDARIVVQAGADYIGLIFSESPRRVSLEQAAAIAETIPARISRVGVFVNEDEWTINSAVQAAGLNLIQLHGEESPQFCERFDLPVIKVFRQWDETTLDLIAAYGTDLCLLEPFVPGKVGGTGKTSDWSLSAQIVKAFPHKKFFLGGGLSPDNVGEAIRTVRPFAVDVSSGLEDSPGIKNHAKIKLFIEVVGQ